MIRVCTQAHNVWLPFPRPTPSSAWPQGQGTLEDWLKHPSISSAAVQNLPNIRVLAKFGRHRGTTLREGKAHTRAPRPRRPCRCWCWCRRYSTFSCERDSRNSTPLPGPGRRGNRFAQTLRTCRREGTGLRHGWPTGIPKKSAMPQDTVHVLFCCWDIEFS